MKEDSRREPSLADLEAFERLLRDGMKSGRVAAAGPDAPPQPHAAISADSALAEFNRLIETPVSFDPQGPQEPPQVLSAIEKALRSDIKSPPEPMPPVARDPMLDFEDELRRFEAMSRPSVANPVEPEPEFRAAYPGHAAPEAAIAPPVAWTEPQAEAQMSAMAEWQNEAAMAEPAPLPGALEVAEDRLAAEAQAGALAGGAALVGGAALAANSKARSRGIFYALGGVAIVGLSVVGGMSLLSGKPKTATGGNVPVIAAKPEPTKERPANPGGLEVPDQNKQVLAPKTAVSDPKPAQVVTQSEQPVDLNQVTRRDSVRVVAPSPFQPANPPATEPPPAANPAPAAPPVPEPRRVQSVKLSDQPTPQPSPTPSAPGTAAVIGGAAAGASIAAIAAGALTPARPANNPTPGAAAAIRPTTPPAVTPAAPRPVAATPPVPAPVPTPPPAAPKADARPQSPVAAATPRPPSPPRAQNAPLPLTSRAPATAAAPARTASAPATGGGGFAIQLASRPSDADARSASQQLGTRYSGQIGGRSPVVVRGEANGKTVYRVRVAGFSQSDANAACDRVRAAGGACFVTRQ